jgi:hypothetical protein
MATETANISELAEALAKNHPEMLLSDLMVTAYELLSLFPTVSSEKGQIIVTEVSMGQEPRILTLSPSTEQGGVRVDINPLPGHELDPLNAGSILVLPGEERPRLIIEELKAGRQAGLSEELTMLGDRLSLAEQVNGLEQSSLLGSTIRLLQEIE